MSQASSPRAVLRLAWPIGVSMISFALKGVVDMLMVGRLGPIALAGVGFAQIAAWMAFTFPWGMLRGQRPLVSQYHGAGDSQASFAFGVQGFYLGAIWGGLLFALAWIAKGFLEGVAGTTALDPEACSLAGEYLKWRLVFALPTILAFAVAEYQRSLERTRIPMLVDIVTHPLNVLFNWALIFGNLGLPALGAKGAAIGTGLADLCALAFLLWKVRPANPLPWKALAFRWNRMKEVLSVGITGGVQFTLENLSFAVISYMVAFLGTLSVAVNQAGISLIHLSLMPAIAIGDGGSVLIGKFIGEKRWDEAARTLRSMLALLIPFMGAMGVVYLLAVHGFQVFRLGEHLADGVLPADVLHFGVVADIDLGRLEAGGENQAFAAAVDCADCRPVDSLLEGMADTSEVIGIVGQGVDIDQALGAGHTRKVGMLDDLERALEQFKADAEGVEPKARGLNQDHQVAGRHRLERRADVCRVRDVEIYEGGVRKAEAIGLRQGLSEVGLTIPDHESRLGLGVLDCAIQNPAQVVGRGPNRSIGEDRSRLD